jgi:hypothetical protein
MRPIKFFVIVSLFSLLYLKAPSAAQETRAAIQIDSTEKIFLDNFIIKSTDNISRRVNQVH